MHNIDTPALIIDLNLMEKNIEKVANFFKGRENNVRPHIKPHKTPIIAHKQLEAGAKGICTAKLGEAELMASVGIKDILIANEIVTRKKVERLAKLSRYCDVKVAVDNPNNIEELSSIAREYETEIGVLVDINLSQFGKIEGIIDRCGVLPGKPAVSLAKKIEKAKGLMFRGIMGYEGTVTGFPKFIKRKEATYRALKALIDTRDVIRESGMEVGIVSAGGTTTWNITGAYPGVTEVQAGSYVLMDIFHKLEGVDLDNALTVLTTVISNPYPSKIITDVGMKSICTARGMPEVKGIEGVEISSFHVEHCQLKLKNPSKKIKVGDKLELIPYFCGPTVNLYDKFYATRRGKVEAEWEIMGRGKGQ